MLDATDKISPYTLTPERIVNTRGFIVDELDSKFMDVIDNKNNYELIVAVKGNIDEKGIMTGDASIKSMSYARRERILRYNKNPDNFKQEYFIKPYPALTISDITFKNSDVDSLPFNQKIIFTTALNNSGAYSYFNTNYFNEFEKNPFIEDHRNTDIDFGYQQSYTIYGNFTIPEGYDYETLPENISMSMRDRTVQYVRSMQVSGKVLNMQTTIQFKSPYYLIPNYSDFQEFYKKMLTSLNEQIVIKKKN